MKVLYGVVLSVLLGSIFKSYGQVNLSDKPLEVYLLIGQSNMSGRGIIETLSFNSSETIFMLNKTNKWVLAKDPLHFDRSYAGVGPGISFAQSMQQDQENVAIGLIPCAWGGSPIKAWESGAKYFNNFPYDEAIKRSRIAMQKGVLKGIIWHQGESDNDVTKSKVYLEKLEQLVYNLRRDLKAPKLPFIAGEIGHFNKQNYINTIINKLPERVKYTAVVSAQDLKDKGDKLHFDTFSSQELGKRYAKAMKILQGKLYKSSEEPTVVLTFDDAEISHYTNVAPLLLEYGFNQK